MRDILVALAAAGLALPALAQEAVGKAVQFERQGYFTADPDTGHNRLVFNRTVALRDSWAKAQAAPA